MPNDYVDPNDPTKKLGVKPVGLGPMAVDPTTGMATHQPDAPPVTVDAGRPLPPVGVAAPPVPFDAPNQPKPPVAPGLGMPAAAPSAPAPLLSQDQIGNLQTKYGANFFNTLNSGQTIDGQTFVHNGQGWTIQNSPASAPAAAPPPPAPAAPPTTPGAPPVGADQPPSIAQSFQQALINKLNPQAIDSSNPAIAPAIEANKLAEQRGMERNRNILAEQAAKNGTDSSGGFQTDLTGLSQDRAAREGQFAGNAVQHLQDQQDQDIMAALGIGNSATQANAARDQQGSQFGQTLAEQKRQTDQDAELKRLGINTQSTLGEGDLSLRGRLGDQQSNLGLLQALLQHNQFGRQLDQQGTQYGEGLDQSGLLGLLGLLR